MQYLKAASAVQDLGAYRRARYAFPLRRCAAGLGEYLYIPFIPATNAVRWVGAVIVDTTQRRNSEDALRKTEKLAAARTSGCLDRRMRSNNSA